MKYREVRAEVFAIIKARQTYEHDYIRDWACMITRTGAQASLLWREAAEKYAREAVLACRLFP